MNDDLFRPTLGAATRDPTLPSPWRIRSQLYVAFFGGIFALLAIAWLNVYRLGGDWRAVGPRLVLLALGAWLVVTAAFMAGVGQDLLPQDEALRYTRWLYRGAAVLLHVVFSRLQVPLDRRYGAVHGETYASLWVPGLVAVMVGSLVQGLLTAAVAWPVLGEGS